MGKRIRSQRRGRGTNLYRAPSHRYKTEAKYIRSDKDEEEKGRVIDIINDPSKNAPIGIIEFDNGNRNTMIISEGTTTKTIIQNGNNAPIKTSNILPLSNIPEGTAIFNIEAAPGDGGKFIRSSGMFGLIVSRDIKKVVVKMPSKKLKEFHPLCKATIGIVAGGERKTKPFGFVSAKYYAMKARNKKYPKTSGVAMNSVDHPFGGSSHPGIPKTTRKTAPPGAKVGSIGARRTGKKRGKTKIN
ncbi:MAG: 50S ribosomal protein L2 [Candidatus Aenigmarchaeota archaeon]|nr:50S ribosomal protein L2 [Candidatus Aenigmarchaeota archaeon]MCK5321968.1 50S ribosomal protein L2 [Candidatus Aenigmarchaeota archaeon]